MYFEEKHSKQNYQTMLHYLDMESIPHCQSSMELLFVSEGAVRATRQNQTFLLTAGHCIWVLPYEVHAYATPDASDTSVFIFSADLAPDFQQDMLGQMLVSPVIPFEPEELAILSNGNPDRFEKKSVLYRLISRVLRGGTLSTRNSADFDSVRKCMLFIQEHYREPITARDLAHELGYSYNYASRLFRSFFPCGFCEMVNMYRLEEAVRLLLSGDLSMTMIAERSGFSTIRNFNMVFKRRYHMSPSEYCRIHLKDSSKVVAENR